MMQNDIVPSTRTIFRLLTLSDAVSDPDEFKIEVNYFSMQYRVRMCYVC